MSTLSAVIKNGQQLGMRSGLAALNPNDMVQIVEPQGEVYPLGTIDYDKVTAAGIVVAETNIDTGNHNFVVYHRHPVLTDYQGNIYVAQAGSTTIGCKVCKLSVSGTRVWQLVFGAGTTLRDPHLVQLSNGNMAVTFYVQSTGQLQFGILDRQSNVIAGTTNIALTVQSTNISYHSTVALAGGGFAVAFANAAGTAMMLTTYDSVGNVVLAPTSIQTFAGTAGTVYTKIAQLNNGNLVVVMRAPTTAGPTPGGTTFVVVTTAGVSVKTNTVVDNTASIAYASNLVQGWTELHVFGAFFAIGGMTGVAVSAGPIAYFAIYNNAGVIQGSKFSSPSSNSGITGAAGTYPQTCIINDGTSFWFAYPEARGGSSALGGLVQATTAGTYVDWGTFSNVALTPALPDTGICSVDMAIVGGNLCIFTSAAAGSVIPNAPSIAFWSLIDTYAGVGTIVQQSTLTIGNAAATQGPLIVRIIGTGLSAICVYDKQNTTGSPNQAVYAAVNKLFTSSIMGVNQSQIAVNTPGQSALINAAATYSPINQLPGTDGTSYDSSAATPPGNKGLLYKTGCTMKGLP